MLERKGFGIRFGALLIDNVIIVVLWQIVWAITKPALPANVLSMSFEEMMKWAERAAGWSNFWLGIFGLGMAVVEIMLAQTPGKMLLKLKIQAETGAPAARDQLIRRAALKYGVYVFYVIGGLLAMQWLVWVGFVPYLIFVVGAFLTLQPPRQGLHDQLGKTAVFGPAVPGMAPMAPGFQPVMPGQPMPPAGTPVTPPPATTMPPPPQM